MSKVSTASGKTPTQLSTQSAWAKGPPQSNSSAPSPRSQSPSHVSLSHSRRPSALGQGVPVKEGVSVSRNNVGSVRQGSSLYFGSIGERERTAEPEPTSSSLTRPTVDKPDVKAFGTLPTIGPSGVNGRISVTSPPPQEVATEPSSSMAPSPSPVPPLSVATLTPTSSATLMKPSINKADIAKLFQGNPSASQPSSDTTSPSIRSSNLPPQPSAQHPPPPPSQLGTHPYPFGPRTSRGGSPAFSRSPQVPSGPSGQPRPVTGPGGPSGSTIPGSPRLNHQSPHTLPLPHHAPQWYFIPEISQFWPYPPSGMHLQTHVPHGPGPQGPHNGMPMSPRNQPPSLPPAPSVPHAVPHPPHTPQPPPPHPHQPPGPINISSPPPTPATASAPGSRSLNTDARAFVPTASRTHKAITIKSEDGTEVNLESLKKYSPQPSIAPIPPPSPITTNRRTASVRIESEEAKRKREEQARLEQEKKEAEERAVEERKRQAEEEARRLEEEQLRREEQKREEERKRQEMARVEEERQREEKERKEQELLKHAKEQEERELREREEREREEREAREREQREREEQELAKKEAEQRQLEEQENEAALESRRIGDKLESSLDELQEPEEGEVIESEGITESQVHSALRTSKTQKESLRIDTTELSRRRPGPLDITAARKDSSTPPLSALMTARNLDRLDEVEYPEGIKSPKVELNQNAKDGKFRYDRDFLLQFMAVCKEKPPHLPPLDILGIEPVDQSTLAMTRGGSGRHRQPSGVMSAVAARSASVGLGIGLNKPGVASNFSMGQFSTPASKLTSEERFLMPSGARSASLGSSAAAALHSRPAMARTTSQGGPGHPISSHRTRSKRGEKRSEPGKATSGRQGSGFGPATALPMMPLEPVAALEMSANRWVSASSQRKGATDADTPETVDRKVRSLLNKLTVEKFGPISDQIIAWANKSENETDGRSLIQVIKLIFEKATDEANWSEMYARLCCKMMEKISPKVHDDSIKSVDKKLITGGMLFRKYLLNRCQEDFERGWVAKEATARAAAAKASNDQAVKAANKKGDESELYSDEYYAAQKAKRQGLGLIKFIGELFKLQMLTERIMHECVKKLLSNVESPEEEEIESLCQLLRTVGELLDRKPTSEQYMDVYFVRMLELSKSTHITLRMSFMLRNIIELRQTNWVPQSKNQRNAPTTLAEVHETAAKDKEKAAQEAQRQPCMSRGGSKRGAERGAEAGADGWAPARPQPKAGDLSNFGKISKAAPMIMGPSSVFAGKKDNKRESLTRTNSSSNMFSMLSQHPELTVEAKPSRAPSRKPSTDLDRTDLVPQRRKLQLLPRSKPAPGDATAPASDDEPDMPSNTFMSDEDADKKIQEDVKEFFAVRNLEEADAYFANLMDEHRSRLIDKLVRSAVERKEADARLVAEFFARPASREQCSAQIFEDGFMAVAELLDDIVIDAPRALPYMAMMVKGAGLDTESERLAHITDKALESGDELKELVLSERF